METGAEAVEGSPWVRGGGGDRKIEKDCELASAEESMSGHLTQV